MDKDLTTLPLMSNSSNKKGPFPFIILTLVVFENGFGYTRTSNLEELSSFMKEGVD